MKKCFLFLITVFTFSWLLFSCKKDSFITSADALLFTSTDTLHFDTVFTGNLSITQSFKIFNPNSQKLLLSNVVLAGGNTSAFKLNVDGTPGSSFSDIEIAPNDSIYVFVAANVNSGAASTPFLVQDSIQINYNGKAAWVQLDAYGQNAHYLRNASVTKDTAWNNDLPVVILGSLTINDGSTLTINKGVKAFCHAGAKIIVNGSLWAIGEKYDSTRITFTGDRLDDYYNSLPASWGGIVYTESSINNTLTYTEIKNATDAITISDPSNNANPKLTLDQCIINNAQGSGIFASNTSVSASNCLISNCGSNINITAGGSYNFIHCTVASYSNLLVNHINPVLSISNADSSNHTFPLDASFTNSIFYADDGIVSDEVLVDQQGSTTFNLNFENDLYKAVNTITGNFTNCIQNADPLFVDIDTYDNIYDFHLQEGSPCINTAKNLGISVDLDGNTRGANPDIGCYEMQ